MTSRKTRIALFYGQREYQPRNSFSGYLFWGKLIYSYLKSKQMIYTILLKKWLVHLLLIFTACSAKENIVLSILLVQIVLIWSHFVSQKLVKDILPHGILKDSEISKMIHCFDSDGDGKVCLRFPLKFKNQCFYLEPNWKNRTSLVHAIC